MLDLHHIALQCFGDYGSADDSSDVSICEAEVEDADNGDEILVGCTVHICVWGSTHDDIDLGGECIDEFCECTGLVLQAISFYVTVEGALLYLHANIMFTEPDADEEDEVVDEVVEPQSDPDDGELERAMSDAIEADVKQETRTA